MADSARARSVVVDVAAAKNCSRVAVTIACCFAVKVPIFVTELSFGESVESIYGLI